MTGAPNVLVRVFSHPEQAVLEACQQIVDMSWQVADLRLALPTGRTPVKLYAALREARAAGDLNCAAWRVFGLDEYLGLGPRDPRRCRRTLEDTLLRHLGVPEASRFFPPGGGHDLGGACQAYERRIQESGGLDVVVLGIGQNGHIAFNEPPSSLGSRARVVALSEQTRAGFPVKAGEKAPELATTLGVGSILKARAVVLLAFGHSKSEAVRAAIEGPIGAICPASALQLHPQAWIYLDEEAASELQRRDAYAQSEAVVRAMGRGNRDWTR